MKKTAIVLAVLTASLFAVSCQKENNPEATGFAPMTINAVSEGIGATTKVEMAYKYDLLWQNNDEILVKNTTGSAVFALNGGAGTTKGTFSCSASPFKEGDAVEAFYPQSIVDGNNLVWPATLTNNQTVPMYSTKTLSATEDETFNFSSLGSVFQLIFSTESKDVVLQSIELKADEAMSGVFTVSNGQAVMPTDGDKPGITLDLGETGVALGIAAKKFNIAIPAGIYNNLTIILTAKDGRECEIKAKNAQTIAYNTVSTLTISGTFKYTPIEGDVLPGKFSVSADKHVSFSKGNLQATYNGTNYTWGFAPNQYDCIGNATGNTSIDNQTDGAIVDLFGWSTTATNYGISTSMTISDYSGDFVDWGNNFGGGSFWRTLTCDEWVYLFNDRTMTNDKDRYTFNITFGGKTGVVLYPDDYNGSVLSSSTEYTDENFPEDCVFLPIAGYRERTEVLYTSSYGAYWSSSIYENYCSYFLYFDIEYANPSSNDYWDEGQSVRLVTDVK